METRVCAKCQQAKSIDQYSRTAGNRTKCRDCYLQMKYEWNRNNPEKVRQSVKKYLSTDEAKEKRSLAWRKWKSVNRPYKIKVKKEKCITLRFCGCGSPLEKRKKYCSPCKDKHKEARNLKRKNEYHENKDNILPIMNSFKAEQRASLDDQYILKKLRDNYGIPRNIAKSTPGLIEIKRKQLLLKRKSYEQLNANAGA